MDLSSLVSRLEEAVAVCATGRPGHYRRWLSKSTGPEPGSNPGLLRTPRPLRLVLDG